MKKVYLDVCTLCRPFDNQGVMRIRLETDAYYLILNGIQNKEYEMVISPVHFKEIESIEDIREKMHIIQLLHSYGKEPSYNFEQGKRRVEELASSAFGIADAAHVAFAEQAAEYFITCDDKLRKRSTRTQCAIEILSPIEFCIKEDLR